MYFDPLPSDLLLPQPMLSGAYNPAVLHKLDQRGEFIAKRSYRGCPVIAEICEYQVRLYTASMHGIGIQLDYLRSELAMLPLRPGTVLVGEAWIPNCENHAAATCIVEGSHEEVVRLTSEGYLPEFRVFAMPFHSGRSLCEGPYWAMHLRMLDCIPSGAYVHLAEQWQGRLTSLDGSLRALGWSGAVVYDGNYRYSVERGKASRTPRPGYYLR